MRLRTSCEEGSCFSLGLLRLGLLRLGLQLWALFSSLKWRWVRIYFFLFSGPLHMKYTKERQVNGQYCPVSASGYSQQPYAPSMGNYGMKKKSLKAQRQTLLRLHCAPKVYNISLDKQKCKKGFEPTDHGQNYIQIIYLKQKSCDPVLCTCTVHMHISEVCFNSTISPTNPFRNMHIIAQNLPRESFLLAIQYKPIVQASWIVSSAILNSSSVRLVTGTGSGLLGGIPRVVVQISALILKRATVGVRAPYATRRNSGMKRIKCGWTQPLFRKVRNHQV